MSDLQRVPAPRLPFARHGEFAALALVLIVATLIAKPWGAAAPPGSPDASPSGLRPTASADVAVAGPTPFEAGYRYDQTVFGPFEPNPEWSIWPGGFFVTVLYVTRAPQAPEGAAPSGAPGTSPPASANPTDSASATLAPSPAATPAPRTGWPASVTIGPGDHLLWLGLDTPPEWTVRSANVWRRAEEGSRLEVPVVELPSRWGPHFTIIGIPVAPGSERLEIWPMGTYDVEVTLDPDGSMRSFRVEIQTLGPDATEPPADHPR